MQKYTPYISKVLLTIVGMISLTTFYACSGGGSKKPDDSTIVQGGGKASEKACVANEDGSISCEIPEGVSLNEDGTLDGTVFVGGENGIPLSEEDYEIKDGKIIIKNVEKLGSVIKGKDLDVCVMGADGECTSVGKVSVGVEEEKKEDEEKKDPEPGAILCQQTGCPEGQECGADGVCHNKADVPPPPPPVGCLNPNNPCPAGQVCGADGTCQVVIAPPPPPPPPPPVECTVDGDCNDPTKKCSAQHCVVKVCGIDFQCSNTQTCENNVCVEDPSKMDTDADGIKNNIDQCPATPANPELGVDNKGCSKLEVNFVTTGNEKTEKLTNTKAGLVRINWAITGSAVKEAYIYFTVPKPKQAEASEKSNSKADKAKKEKFKKKKKKGPEPKEPGGNGGPKKPNPKAKKKGPKPGMMSLGGIEGVGAEIDQDQAVEAQYLIKQQNLINQNAQPNVGANAINNMAGDDGSCDDLSALMVDEKGNMIEEDSLAYDVYGDFLDEAHIERCNAFNCYGFAGDPDDQTMTCKINLMENLTGPFYHLLTMAHTPYTLVARGENNQWVKKTYNMDFTVVDIGDVSFSLSQTAPKLQVIAERVNARDMSLSGCTLEATENFPDNEENNGVFANLTGKTSFLCDLKQGLTNLTLTAYGVVDQKQKKYGVNLGNLSISKFNEKGTMTCDQAGMGSDNCSGKYTLQWQLSRALTVTDKTDSENPVEKNVSGSEKIWVQSVKVQAQRTDNGTWENQASCSDQQQGMVDSNDVITCQVDRNHNYTHWKIIVTDLDGEQVAPQTNSYPYVPYLESTPNSWQCDCSFNHTCTYAGFCGDDECHHGGDWDCSTWGHKVTYAIKFVEFFKGKHLKEIKKIGDCPFNLDKQPPDLDTAASYQEPEYKLQGTVGERTFSCTFQGIGYDGSVHTIFPNCDCSEHTW